MLAKSSKPLNLQIPKPSSATFRILDPYNPKPCLTAYFYKSVSPHNPILLHTLELHIEPQPRNPPTTQKKKGGPAANFDPVVRHAGQDWRGWGRSTCARDLVHFGRPESNIDLKLLKRAYLIIPPDASLPTPEARQKPGVPQRMCWLTQHVLKQRHGEDHKARTTQKLP